MAHIGVSESYDAITSKKRKRKKVKNVSNTSTDSLLSLAAVAADNLLQNGKERSLPQLSDSMVHASTDSLLSSPAVAADDPLQIGKGGSLRQLSGSMVNAAQAIASTGLFATSYNNINMVFCAAEQIVV
jgi:hypothetical protein